MLKIKHTGIGKCFYATSYSAGFDIPANEYRVLKPGEHALISTGLFLMNNDQDKEMLDIVNKNQKPQMVPELQIRSRSGLAWKNRVVVLNSPGTIDFDYVSPKEIKVMLINHGTDDFEISPGDRIAQGVCCLTVRCPDIEVQDVTRTGGFGSTGVNDATN